MPSRRSASAALMAANAVLTLIFLPGAGVAPVAAQPEESRETVAYDRRTRHRSLQQPKHRSERPPAAQIHTATA
jgi:hypothetical protein